MFIVPNRVNRLREQAQNDSQSTFEEIFKDTSLSIHHQNIQRPLIEIHKHDIPTNIYGDQFIRNNRDLNMRSRLQPKIPSINSELKGKKVLLYHGSVLRNNIPYEIRNHMET